MSEKMSRNDLVMLQETVFQAYADMINHEQTVESYVPPTVFVDDIDHVYCEMVAGHTIEPSEPYAIDVLRAIQRIGTIQGEWVPLINETNLEIEL